jgi:hypothetical protein
MILAILATVLVGGFAASLVVIGFARVFNGGPL